MKKVLMVLLLNIFVGGCMYPTYVRMGDKGSRFIKYYDKSLGNVIILGAVTNLATVTNLIYDGRVVADELVAGSGVITNLSAGGITLSSGGDIKISGDGMINLLGSSTRIFSTGTNNYLNRCGVGILNASRAYALFATNVYLYIRGSAGYSDKLGLIQYTGGTNLYFSEIVGTNYIPYRISLVPVP